jgi:hypothetical protein
MSKEPHLQSQQHPSKTQPKASSQMEGNQATTARKGYDADPKQNPQTGAGQPDPRRQTGQSSAERAGRDPNQPQDEEPVDQAELDKDKPTLKKEEAEQLLRSGTRLRRRGDPPANWISMTRHGNDMVIAMNATPEMLDHFLAEEYITAD